MGKKKKPTASQKKQPVSTEKFLEKCREELQNFNKEVVPKFLAKARSVESMNDKDSIVGGK